ncbi:MAG: polyprenyl synthetase family protein [Candidatus Adiutrix sp.]|nr:polyprenyl synthetase family protein [Candidatus Adiutrix sp.]
MTTMTTTMAARTATRTTGRCASDFGLWRARSLELINGGLEKALGIYQDDRPAAVGTLGRAMAYSLLGGGKRLRPLLALAAGQAVGGRLPAALPAALAVEMVHAYSLIHDDLPAMDDDDLRRGRPTCHKVFGEALAILAGDALLALAFETLARAAGQRPAAAPRVNRALLELARAAGGLSLVGGQALDLSFEKRPLTAPEQPAPPGDLSLDMVRDMEERKTGRLITAALVCGAALAGAEAPEFKRLKRLGRALGLAFQIQDDLLNQCGDPARLGKAVGSDARRGKASFSLTGGREAAERELAALIDDARQTAGTFKAPGGRLLGIIDSLTGRQA